MSYIYFKSGNNFAKVRFGLSVTGRYGHVSLITIGGEPAEVPGIYVFDVDRGIEVSASDSKDAGGGKSFQVIQQDETSAQIRSVKCDAQQLISRARRILRSPFPA